MDNLMLGLSTTAIGMLVVFFGLLILIACICAMTMITGRAKKTAAKEPLTEPAQETAPAVESAAEEAAAADEQLVAVISAAIAAVWQDEKGGFVVRRIRRCQNSSARARAAREEQIFSRM